MGRCTHCCERVRYRLKYLNVFWGKLYGSGKVLDPPALHTHNFNAMSIAYEKRPFIKNGSEDV